MMRDQMELLARRAYRGINSILPPIGQSVLKKISPLGKRLIGSGNSVAPAMDLQEIHTRIATNYLDLKGKKVLVVGCNRGRECELLLKLGADQVHGLDVIDAIGAEVTHPQISYFKMSVEEMDFEDSTYDLVYSLATLEHVPNIAKAYPEMARVTSKGGIIYCVAAPLWNSAYGHHKKEIFKHFPWIHLRMNREEILQFCEGSPYMKHRGEDLVRHLNYMLNPKFFNMTPASEYLDSCSELKGVEIIKNQLDYRDEDLLTQELFSELSQKGYTREELLGTIHTLVAKKLSENSE